MTEACTPAPDGMAACGIRVAGMDKLCAPAAGAERGRASADTRGGKT